MVRNFKDLEIWKEAHELALILYKITQKFPSSEQYGLVSQIRRSSTSIGANISEGCGQNTSAATKRYIFISYSSLQELKYHLILAKDLDYISKEKYETLDNRYTVLSKRIYTFIKNMPNQPHYILPDT